MTVPMITLVGLFWVGSVGGVVSADAPTASAAVQRATWRTDEREVRRLVSRIEKQSDRFRKSVDRALDRSRLDGTRREDEMNRLVKQLEDAADRLDDRVKDEEVALGAAREVLRRGAAIDAVVRRRDFGSRAEREWRVLRADLERLARLYRLAVVWDAGRGRR